MTYSSSFNDEHATTINGEGKNPTIDDILDVGKNIGIKPTLAKNIALEIQEKCKSLTKKIKFILIKICYSKV